VVIVIFPQFSPQDALGQPYQTSDDLDMIMTGGA